MKQGLVIPIKSGNRFTSTLQTDVMLIVFCDRKGEAVINGYSLKMTKSEEPDAGVYKRNWRSKNYKEIVFCGYGEPTIRWEFVKQVAKYIKDNGGATRMNTDGHGNLINKRDITPR